MKWMVLLVWVAVAQMAGCSGDRAQSLYETAQLEEKQNSTEHARSLYREILAKYPDAAVAADARRRLEALGDSR